MQLRTIGHELVQVLCDLLRHHVGPALLVGWRSEHGHEHVRCHHRQCLQRVLADLAMDDLQQTKQKPCVRGPGGLQMMQVCESSLRVS